MKSSPTLERAVLHEHRRDGTLARVELCFDDGSLGAAIGIRLEVEDFRLKENLIEQRVDVRALLRRDLGGERAAAELLEHDAVLQELLLDLARVRLRQIDLVDRDDERHAGVLGVRDRFDRLRHDGVVGGDDENDDVRDLRAARTHGGERFVARRVEERDDLPVRQRHVIRADVLRDAARFARDDVRLADVVEQRRLTVVDVTHDRDDRRTRHEILGRVDLRGRAAFLGLIRVFANGLEAELAGDQFDLVEVEALVDRDHQSEVLERERDDLGRGDLQDLRELADRDEFVDADGLPLALGLGGARRLELFARCRDESLGTPRATARRAGWPSSSRCSHPPLPDRPLRACPSCDDHRDRRRRGRATAATLAAATTAAAAATTATTAAARAPVVATRGRRDHRPAPPTRSDAAGNRPLLATGRGRGAPGVIGRGRGRSGAAGMRVRGRRGTRAVARPPPVALTSASAARGFGALGGDRRSRGLGLRARGFLGAHRFDARGFECGRASAAMRFLLGGVRRGGFARPRGGCRLLFGGGLNVGRLAATTDGFAGAAGGHGLGHRLRSGRRATATRAVGAGAACFSARTRFSRSQRARMRATWSSVSMLMWLRIGMSICRRSVTTSSADTANSFANSLTESLLKHPPHVPMDGSPLQLANAGSKLPVDDADDCRLITSDRRAQARRQTVLL